ncbi:XTP/dITP diphosphatase [Candidatus Micrarchaeota archaeon]|nr:XTP/dITP diphosphatase [Candidatus Micrarchaeota archaeon]
MKEIIFVTSNKGKLKEAKEILKEAGIKVKGRKLNIEEKRAENLEEIAKDSALKAYKKVGKPLIVEDAGLFIEGLEGFPGPYSAWVFKKLGNKGILRLVEKNRKAYFKSVIAYTNGRGVKLFSGIVKGKIAKKEKGKQGFGYDPIFIPEGRKKTFSEDAVFKNLMSHRKRAFKNFVSWCRNGKVTFKEKR